jgi:hypothetical protein
MHSSQYSVLQQGVRTASRSNLAQIGQDSALSVPAFSRTSASVNAFGLVCFFHDCLSDRHQLVAQRRIGIDRTHVSGCTITKLPSAVIMTPALPPSPAAGCSTVLRNDLGIPVVRLNRGLFSHSGFSFVGQAWIQCPGKAHQARSTTRSRSTRCLLTLLTATITDVSRGRWLFRIQ